MTKWLQVCQRTERSWLVMSDIIRNGHSSAPLTSVSHANVADHSEVSVMAGRVGLIPIGGLRATYSLMARPVCVLGSAYSVVFDSPSTYLGSRQGHPPLGCLPCLSCANLV